MNFFKSSTKQGSINFISSFQSRNAIGRLVKTYLHQTIEILYLLLSGDFKNVSHSFKIFNTPPAS